MKKVIKIGVLYLSKLEIENFDDEICISMNSNIENAKIFYDDNFLSIAINLINNTFKIEVETEILIEEVKE